MERLTRMSVDRLRELGAWVSFEAMRWSRAFRRRLGRLGMLTLACACVGVVALALKARDDARIAELQRQLLKHQQVLRPVPASASPSGARARLRAFDTHLLPHDEIPGVLQDMLNQAEDAGLQIAHGEYRPQPDSLGGFLRYRMALPVKGQTGQVLQFMQDALRAHETLALESVQFRRERPDAQVVEARLQLTLLTQLPRAAAPEAAP